MKEKERDVLLNTIDASAVRTYAHVPFPASVHAASAFREKKPRDAMQKAQRPD
jgi:hypothetical protein